MEDVGDGSQGPGARSSGEPKEQDVLSGRPSPSEPGLASESEVEMRKVMRRQLGNSGNHSFTQETVRRVRESPAGLRLGENFDFSLVS